MAASSTEVANMALSHLGIGVDIADLDTEESQEADAINKFYDTALDMILRDVDWGFARKQAALALVNTYEINDGYEFKYAYRYPSRCVKARRILSGARVDTMESMVSFREGLDADGKLIFTDASTENTYNSSLGVFMEYTTNDVPVEYWPADFTMAFSYMLASLVASRLTGGDPLGLGNKALQKYYLTCSMANKNDVQESAPDVPYESEFIRVRSE